MASGEYMSFYIADNVFVFSFPAVVTQGQLYYLH